METMKDFWSLNEGTFYCLYDQKRTQAFQRAIKNSIKEGDVVLEVGAGTGVLSMFAVDAGASKVYAVEIDKNNTETLKETIEVNGYENSIEVIEGNITDIDLSGITFDAIIAELIATGLIEELQVPVMNHVLQFAKKDAAIILMRYDILAQLVYSKETFYGKTFKAFRYAFPDKTSLRPQPLSDEICLQTVDFRKLNKNSELDTIVTFTIDRPGVLNGIKIAGLTHFSDGSTLDHSLSYSFPIILPIETREVMKGERFKLMISYSLCEGPHRLRYQLTKLKA